MRVGFVGVGRMGGAMAKNVIRGGHTVIVYDMDNAAIADTVQAGAQAGESCKAVTQASEVVITMLPEPEDVETAVLGAGGILEGASPGLIYIDMSTNDYALSKRLAKILSKHGIAAIDCPVGRSQAQAITGSLLLMAAGDKATIEKVRPVLMCMGEELIYCGGNGMGQAMKLVNNMLGAIITQGNTEALTLGVSAGLDLRTMLSVLSKTSVKNEILTAGFPAKALKGDFRPGFTVQLGRKDLGLAVRMAQRLNVPVPLAALTVQQYSTIVAAGYGDKDTGIVLGAQADFLGLEMRLAD